MSHVSMVPNSSSPASAFARAPGTFSRIQRSFVPLKYGSIRRPVFSRYSCVSPSSFSSSQNSAVRRHCQTMALYTGRPVAFSQTTVVSRWLVMPMVSMVSAVAEILRKASLAVSSWVDQISIESCSTQPACG